jgi:hypothetical protein
MLKETAFCGKVASLCALTLSLVACSNIPNNEVVDFDGSVAHDIQLLLDPLSGTVSPIVVNDKGFASVSANVCIESVTDVPIAFKNACAMSGGYAEGDFCINNDNGLYTSTYAYFVDKVCQTDKFLIKVVIEQSHSDPQQFDAWARVAHKASKGQ